MSQPTSPLQAVKQLTQKLSANNSRVTQLTNSLLAQMQALSTATIEQDWSSVHRISETLYRFGRQQNIDALADQAQQVYQAVRAPHNLVELKRQVIKLIGVCGRLPNSQMQK